VTQAGRFALSDEQLSLMADARELAREVLVPLARAGEPGRLNRPLVRALGEHGLLGRVFPAHVGGRQPVGVSAMELCLLRMALAQECVDAETALALQGLGSFPILRSGSDTLVQEWLPAVARGELVAAFALTEPNAGSDAGALELRADRVPGGYRLTGEKLFISNGPEADIYTVFARTTPGARARGVSAFAVPGDSPGLSGTHLEMVSSSHAIAHMRFDGVEVPDEHLLGEVDRGFQVAMGTLELFRPSVGAAAVGMGRAALDAAVRHADQREAFGSLLRDFQGVSHKIADMATDLEAAALLVYAAASAYDEGRPGVGRQSAMAKLFATEAAQVAIDASVQIHGAAGLRKGHLLEQLYREVRALRIYEGASEIQREIVVKDIYRELNRQRP
jgi:acyl-CoA dehydrogenase